MSETATEKLLQPDVFFAQPEEEDSVAEVGKPKSRSASAFLESLQSNTPDEGQQ